MTKRIGLALLAAALLAGAFALGRYAAPCRPATPAPAPAPEVPLDARDVRPLLPGARVGEMTLRTHEGQPFDLARALDDKTTVLVFYRGGWGHVCNTQLAQLKGLWPRLTELGCQLIVVSPDSPPHAAETVRRHGLEFPVLSDQDVVAAKAFGVAFRLDEKALREYEADFGVDIEAASGRTHHVLPVPSVFVIDRDRRVRYQHANPAFRDRIDPEVLLAEAEAVAQPRGRE